MLRLITVIGLFLCALSQAYADSVHLMLSEDTAAYQQAAKDIREQLQIQGFKEQISVNTIEDANSLSIDAGDLIVSVGQKAAELSSRQFSSNTQIYSYIDKNSLPERHQDNWAAVILDQPLQRLYDIASTVVEGRYQNKLIIAVSEDNQPIRNEIASLKLNDKIQMEVLVINQDIEPAKVIDKALFNSGALIAIRDKRIWSGENAKWMLYQSYKYNVPVIGYSKSFLKAGALVSVYTSLQETAATTAKLIIDWQKHHGQLTQEGILYPRYTTEFNKNIARALKITIPDPITLGEKTDVSD